MPNKLIHETSPYLLQHANNPVDWYPWGDEALDKARNEHKPIFLSIGYAACHWCHVMEHESFEDPETAALLNKHFVSIKVDREERPDLDSIYMSAVVTMTGQGGWPMSVFLTPQGEPFFGGTYFPSTRRYNMPSFREVLQAIAQSWQNEAGEIHRVSQEVTEHLREQNTAAAPSTEPLDPAVLDNAAGRLTQTYDWQMGGWGRAPRFPQPMTIEFLLMQAARGKEQCLETAVHILHVMSRGGLYDVVGGGFHRYSTDDAWLVPHFEKMLYDNAQLALAYLHGYAVTGSAVFRQVCTETLDFIAREMRHPEGGFFSSLDADSEGEEGKYYLWSKNELETAITGPAERDLLSMTYPISARGNFEGRIVLQRKFDWATLASLSGLSEDQLIHQLGAIHQKLASKREQRIRPLTDDKVLTSWNALALRTFAQAARCLQRDDYLAVAQQNADFLLRELYKHGKLLRAWRDGQARQIGFLEDYAGLILGLLDLYQSDFDPRWYAAAKTLSDAMTESFSDPSGGFFDTPAGQEGLILRPKELQDNATPSGNALAALALLTLAAFDQHGSQHENAVRSIGLVQKYLVQHPTAFGLWLQAADLALGPVRQVAVIPGNEDQAATKQMLQEIWNKYRPHTVTAVAAASGAPQPGLLNDRVALQGKTTIYVCQDFACQLPVHSIEGLREQLRRLDSSSK